MLIDETVAISTDLVNQCQVEAMVCSATCRDPDQRKNDDGRHECQHHRDRPIPVVEKLHLTAILP